MPLRVPTAWSSVVRSRVLLAGLVGALVLAVVLAASARAEQPPGKTLEVKGVVRAYEQADLYARIPGFVKKWTADIGDRVKKGEVLAELDVPELAAELQQKKAQVVQAEVGVEQARQAVQVTEAAARKAQTYIDEANADLQRARAVLERARADYQRAVQLAEQGGIDRATLDERRRHVQEAEAGVQQAAARIETAKAGVAEGAVLRGKAQVDVQAAEAAVKVAQADMQRVSALLEFAQVRAPFDGVVINRLVNTGDFVSPTPGQKMEPMFTVMRIDMVRVVVEVPEANALTVVPGARALVRFPALEGRKIAGTVTRTAVALDPRTATLRVEIHLPNPENRLRPGMVANVELQLPAEEPRK
jgi:HlyD family secretion protein